MDARQQIQLSINRLQLESSNSSKLVRNFEDLASDLKKLHKQPPPNLDSLLELIRIGNALALLPSEALVRKLVDTLLSKLEDLSEIPNQISARLDAARKVT